MSAVSLANLVGQLTAQMGQRNLQAQANSRWRLVTPSKPQEAVVYQNMGRTPIPHSTTFIAGLQRMQQLFNEAKTDRDTDHTKMIEGLFSIQKQIDADYMRWQNKSGWIHWIKSLVFGSSLDKAYVQCKLTLLTKIQELQHQRPVQDAIHGTMQALASALRTMNGTEPEFRQEIDADQLHELVQALANATSDDSSSIHELYKDMKELNLPELQAKVLQWLTPQRVRENPPLLAILQKLPAVTQLSLFPTLTLRNDEGKEFVVTRVLAQALSGYCDTLCEGRSELNTLLVEVPFPEDLLQIIAGCINFGRDYEIRNKEIKVYIIAAFLKMDTLLRKCREEIHCDGPITLLHIAALPQFSTDLVLKLKCLLFLRARNFAYPSEIVLPQLLKDLNEEFKTLPKLATFCITENKISDSDKAFMTGPLVRASCYDEKVLGFCLHLGIEHLQVYDDVDLALTPQLQLFKTLKFDRLQITQANVAFFETLLSSKSLVHLDLGSVTLASEVADRVRRALQNTCLQSLDLRNAKLSETGQEIDWWTSKTHVK